MPRMTPMREMGSAGIPIFGGYIVSLERNWGWVGRQKYLTTSEMATNVSIIAAGVHYFLNLIAHPKWKVVPVSDDNPEAVKLAEFMDDVLHSMETPWERIVRRAGLYRFHGFSVQEWTAKKRDDNKIGFKDVEQRSQYTVEQWVTKDDGSLDGVWQRSPQTNALLPIPRSKMLYLVEDTLSDSPEGVGMFRHMAEPWNRLKKYLELETLAFERDLRGTPIGRAPLTAIREALKANKITQVEANALIQGMQNFVEAQVKSTTTGMVLDSMPYTSTSVNGPQVAGVMQWGLELLQGSSNGMAELQAAIDRIQREMARIIGTESLMLGDGAGGANRALSEDKSRNLYLTANSVLGNIAAQATKDLIEPIWLLNNFDAKLMPTLSPEDVTFKDVQQIANTLRDMATAGAILDPSDPVIDDVRDLLGVSRPDHDAMAADAINIGGGNQDNQDNPDNPDNTQPQQDQPVTANDNPDDWQLADGTVDGFYDQPWKQYGDKTSKNDDDLEKYSPVQRRVSSGNREGGRFTSTGAGTRSGEDPKKPGLVRPGAGTQTGQGQVDAQGKPIDDDAEHKRMEEILNTKFEHTIADEFVNSLPPEVQDKIKWAEAEQAKGTPTAQEFMKDGQWTPERQALHEKILDEFFNEKAVQAATPKEGEQPDFVMLGGRPGAGKTTALNSGVFPIDTKNYVVINADEFQTHLPGYKPHLAGLYTQEGQYLAEAAEKIARESGINIIYDATMKSTMPAVERAKALKKAGYKTSVFFVHVRPQISAKRALVQRFMNPKDGRYVPAKVLINAVTNEQTFAHVQPLSDRWALFDGNGPQPKLVAAGGQ
jgi:predicted ABC-type ATPase